MTTPKVGLGMPVYNAERHLADALDSLLAQTFDEFELVISDNASTDGTEEICRTYAEKDERISYFRNRDNYGLINNFNNVFRLSHGEYFKWCSSDDVCAPDYLKRAVEVLDDDPSIVLAFSLIAGIDEDGRPTSLPGQLSDRGSPDSVSSPDPVIRFRKLIRNMWWVDAPFYGVMRTAALSQTSLHPYEVNGDQLLIAELCLQGPFYEIPDELFFSRYHANKTSARQKNMRQRAELVENRPLGGGISDRWKMIRGYPMRIVKYVSFVHNAHFSLGQRVACYYEILRTLSWWMRLKVYRLLSRVGDFEWLRPNYPPRT